MRNDVPFPEIANSPLSTMPGAKDVLYNAVASPPVAAAMIATARHMSIAVMLSFTAKEHELNDANCDFETISISPTARTDAIRQMMRFVFNCLKISRPRLAPYTFSMFISLMLKGMEAIEKLM